MPETRWDHCLETKMTTAPAKENKGADIENFRFWLIGFRQLYAAFFLFYYLGADYAWYYSTQPNWW